MKKSSIFKRLVFVSLTLTLLLSVNINNYQTNSFAHNLEANFTSISVNKNVDLPLVSTDSYSIDNDKNGISDYDITTTIPGIDNSAVLVIRGDAYRKVLVTNPGGVSLIQDYDAINYSQRITPISSTSVEVELFTNAYIETNNDYPISPSLFPVDVQQYLEPVSGSIQSDDPRIISLAQQIMNGSNNQTQIIENTMMWLQNNIVLHEPSVPEPQDALSVLLRGTAVCMGYSNLTAAILRSVGIPTKVVTGCTGTIGHAWNEMFFYNNGWFPSSSQGWENYMQGVIYMPGAFCNEYTFQIIEDQFNAWPIYSFTTPYEIGLVYAAENPLWNRVPFNFTPSNPSFLIDKDNQVFQLNEKVDYDGARTNRWIATTTTSWLSPSYVVGYDGETITISINLAGYPNGTYQGEIIFRPDSGGETEAEKILTITVNIVEHVYNNFLPTILN